MKIIEWKLFSDIRVDLLFLAVLLLFPINTAKGYSIVLLHLMDVQILSNAYVYLIAGFFIALAVSHVAVHIYDEKKGKQTSGKKIK